MSKELFEMQRQFEEAHEQRKHMELMLNMQTKADQVNRQIIEELRSDIEKLREIIATLKQGAETCKDKNLPYVTFEYKGFFELIENKLTKELDESILCEICQEVKCDSECKNYDKRANNQKRG